MEIKFGTDGWRGIIAEDFTFPNLRRVSTAVATYLEEEDIAHKGIVIGYDTRFLAEEFADTVAKIMTSRGIPVYMTKAASPTPVTAHAILDKQAAGAVMLTASHNPPIHNGFKFIPGYAGPALPHVTDRITALIPGSAEKVLGKQELVTVFDPRPAYLEFLARQVDMEKIRRSGLKVVCDPMHGAGIGYIEDILVNLGLDVTALRNWRDPLFGGVMPEPKPELLGDLTRAMMQGEGELGLALDGDADRFGLIDALGEYILPNQVLCLLARYLLEERKLTGTIARTVSTTSLLDRIAAKHNTKIIETPVGFKYQAQAMLESQAFLAGEESGGLSIAGHIPEKDGILACLLMLELTAHYNKPLSMVLEDIYSEYGKVYTRRLDYHCTDEKKEFVLEKIKNWQPEKIADLKVITIGRTDGCKYELEDGSWLLVRPSGTESLFRIYGEAESMEKLNHIQQSLAGELSLQ